MRELERRMDAVEFIRERKTEAARARKTALAVASATGFLAGFLFSRFLPSIIVFLENLGLANALPGSTDVVGWSLVAAATVASAVGTFELSLSLPVRKQGF